MVVVLLKTWQGPREQDVGRQRLTATAATVNALQRFLRYPNLSWHIADDGSDAWYQQAVQALFDQDYTFSNTYANGDIGYNLNMGMRIALSRADIVLHWSDDIVLDEPWDLTAYVDLLMHCEDIGQVRLRPSHPSLSTTQIRRRSQTWHLVLFKSKTRFIVDTALAVTHRRFWDFYGPYPEGLRIDILQEEMSWRYGKMQEGPRIVVPDDMWRRTAPRCLGPSTWEWQIEEYLEQPKWWAYRSYSARHTPRQIPGAYR